MAKTLRIMVSSSVHGNEQLLNRVYSTLAAFSSDYRIWMSHKGTIPVDPALDNFQNCLAAVENCDLFLGIITGNYGSGRNPAGVGITHLEIRRAVALNKARWFLVHQSVDLARQALRPYRLPAGEGPYRKVGDDFQPIAWPKTNPVLTDLKVLEMYEEAMQVHLPLEERTGNWVQPYTNETEVLDFVAAQFSDRKRVSKLLERS